MLAAFVTSGVGIVSLAWALRRGSGRWSHAVPACSPVPASA